MVVRQKCSACSGLGRRMILKDPPNDPSSDEGWVECARCKGTGVEMASRSFEVYFEFTDEIEAREFMMRVAEREDRSTYGIRVAEPSPGLLGRFKPPEDPG